jgi:hypothetical protein
MKNIDLVSVCKFYARSQEEYDYDEWLNILIVKPLTLKNNKRGYFTVCTNVPRHLDDVNSVHKVVSNPNNAYTLYVSDKCRQLRNGDFFFLKGSKEYHSIVIEGDTDDPLILLTVDKTNRFCYLKEYEDLLLKDYMSNINENN